MGDDEVTTPPRARPSLYAAIKLARLVLFVKERFKARIKSRSPPPEPSMICHRDSFKARAFEDVSQYEKSKDPPCLKPTTKIVYLVLLKPAPEAAAIISSRGAIIKRDKG